MRRAAFVAFGLFVAPALAQEPAPVQHAQATPHDPLDCYCRAKGQIFAPGESICLKTAAGGRMAECRMVTNVMSWGITDRACPES
jgi:hypothetical protein